MTQMKSRKALEEKNIKYERILFESGKTYFVLTEIKSAFDTNLMTTEIKHYYLMNT